MGITTGPIYVTSDGYTGCRLCGWTVRLVMTLPSEGHRTEHVMLGQHPDNGCEYMKNPTEPTLLRGDQPGEVLGW